MLPILSWHIDGGAGRNPRATPGSPDLREYDRVEILRGSDALFSGNGSPGGTISPVRKRPLARFLTQ